MFSLSSDLIDNRSLQERLSDFGCHYVVELRGNRVAHHHRRAEYLDLIPGTKGLRSTALPVDAVVEHQNDAMLYIVDGEPEMAVEELQRQLANRSDAAWLGILRPGELEIRPVKYNPKEKERVVKKAAEDNAVLFFQQLVHGHVSKKAGSPKAIDYVAKLIFDQLHFTAQKFVVQYGEEDPAKLSALEVLSMCGRALFFRFLYDRKIVVQDDLKVICALAEKGDLRDVFSTPQKAAQTSAWLDATFNGDFLRLLDEEQDRQIPTHDREARETAYLRYYEAVQAKVGDDFFMHLKAILYGWTVVADKACQPELELDWIDLNFAHIPVGVLSQVYESYSHWAEGEAADEASVHYTPLPIARMMVDQSFGPGAVKKPLTARVLDPACGAGIFLVLAFRRLIQKRWEVDGRQPDTETIRQMMRGQLTGFDVSESALRLAALSLYITAIEMDPEPRPVSKLRFDNLRGLVLHNFADPAQKEGFHIGSLGAHVPDQFNAAFDLVIGNPPWSRLKERQKKTTDEGLAHKKAGGTYPTEAHNRRFTEIGKKALQARKLDDLAAAYTNPDNNPDLPFLWRATLWAREDALIALALPARLILHATQRGAEGWHAVLKAVSLTGLINGAELRWSKAVWTVKVPFCLLFARNTLPAKGHRFAYAAPLHDKLLNRTGRFRIDYQTLASLSTSEVMEKPWLLKTLQVGTWRDVEIVEDIKKRIPGTLESFWAQEDPHFLRTGSGYKVASGLTRNKGSEFIGKMWDFRPDGEDFKIPYDQLKTYEANHGIPTAKSTKSIQLYQHPLVMVPESPGENPNTPKAYLSSQDLAFSASYYGYSCRDAAEGETLAALLYLLPHSKLFYSYILLTSPRFGADRQTFTKEDIDSIPFPDVKELSAETKATIQRLAQELENNPSDSKPWDEIDEFFFDLYRIEPRDRQVLRDTLFSAAPYRKAGKAAFEPVPFEDERQTRTRERFAQDLAKMLRPFFEISGREVQVTTKILGLEQKPSFDVWGFVAIHRADQPVTVDARLLNEAMSQADEYAASRGIVRLPEKGGLLLGLLNEQRWWTQTRASFCAQRIVRDCLDAFDLDD